MSVRTRLAGILAAVMLLPVLVAGVIAGLIAPHQQTQAARDLVTQAATSLGSLETEICRGLGDAATALALDVRGGDLPMAVQDAEKRRADSFAVVTRGSSIIARAGDLPTDAAGTAPTAAALSQLSCAQGQVLPGSLPVLAESVVIPAAQGSGGTATTTAVVGVVLNAAQLTALRDRIGLREGVQIAISCPGGGSDVHHEGRGPRPADRGCGLRCGRPASGRTWWPLSPRCPAASPVPSLRPPPSPGWPTPRTACSCSSSWPC